MQGDLTLLLLPNTGSGVPLMAAGGGAGVITVWNLNERRLHTIIKVMSDKWHH